MERKFIALGIVAFAVLLWLCWLIDERANRTEHYAKVACEAVAPAARCSS